MGGVRGRVTRGDLREPARLRGDLTEAAKTHSSWGEAIASLQIYGTYNHYAKETSVLLLPP